MADQTLVLIPGLLCDGAAWQPVVDRLEADMAIVIADCSTQDSITQMAVDTLDAVEGSLAVAGHSMGGRVALEMVRLAPDRICRMALLDTGVHPRKPGEEVKRQELVDLAYREGMRALAAKWLPPMVHPDRLTDETLMAPLTAMVERMTPELHERQIKALLDRPAAEPVLQKIAVPTALIVGRQDAWSPLAQHEAMQTHIRHASLDVIEDAGHFAPVERPEPVACVLKAWMRSH
ncbi:alpha/beta hydrolase [Rhizobium sp. RU36D]|uniref:alpha/beta fold hydrolase n=1 Tax=Rhizobium sp. RU36D TaxID=1907415 RepID=UPI0009D840D4|nr:alpha/beta hydrolase [Rhizobium sp. RU36D]SMD01418.1 Pimeloyl-ACP methyl ester carboxylesterase [Rhizobium sp. RU36D]